MDEIKQHAVNVALIEEDKVEVKNVFFVEEKEKADMMILDLGVPCSLFGKEWMTKFMEENKINEEDIEQAECNKKFWFGPGKIYVVKKQYKIPIVMKSEDNEEIFV